MWLTLSILATLATLGWSAYALSRGNDAYPQLGASSTALAWVITIVMWTLWFAYT